MRVREGVIPTVLGTAVVATGLFLKPVSKKVSWGITAFGLAHVILGTIDIIENK